MCVFLLYVLIVHLLIFASFLIVYFVYDSIIIIILLFLCRQYVWFDYLIWEGERCDFRRLELFLATKSEKETEVHETREADWAVALSGKQT